MISDILDEAIRDIKKYLRDYPDTYKDLRKEIFSTITSMDNLRAKLDKAPKKLKSDSNGKPKR